MGVVGKIWDVVSCQRRRVPLPPNVEKSSEDVKAPSQSAEGQSKEEAQAAAKAMKEKGNELFKKNEFEDALYTYTKAAEIYMYDASIWLNRSICNRKLENWEDAATDAEIAQEIDPKNAKAYYNRAVALQLGSKPEEALEICKKGLQVQADNKALQQLKGDLQRHIAEAHACPGQMASTTAPTEMSLQEAKTQVEKVEGPVYSQDGEYQWKNRKPSEREREEIKKAMTDMFRSKYEELKQRTEAIKSKRSTLQTDQYEDNQKQGLVLSGGHRPLDRPENVDLPSNYQQAVGLLSPTDLEEYGCDNRDRRYLLSVYGNVFDVSDRPDKYDPHGPYASLTGKDLTWGLFAGVDTVEYTNKFYDLFKAKDLGKDKMAGVCSWLAWYETEYGKPVGKLTPWQREAELPAPPLEEIEEMCVVM